MRSIRKTAVGAVAALAAAVTVGVAGPASAAKNPYTPKEVCGSGYFVVDDPGGIGGKAKRRVKYQPTGATWGHVYLLYNNSTDKNCVVTIKKKFVGKKTRTGAWLRVKGGPDKKDVGKFKYYAGPAKRYAPGKCVKYWGLIRSTNGHSTAVGGRTAWGNCG